MGKLPRIFEEEGYMEEGEYYPSPDEEYPSLPLGRQKEHVVLKKGNLVGNLGESLVRFFLLQVGKVYQKLFGREGIFVAAQSVQCPACQKLSGLSSDYRIITDTFCGGDSNDGNNAVHPPTCPVLVMMWSGSYNDIPSGWQLCDGTNGTPDLRDKFVYGVNTSYGPGDDGDLGATGGATSHSHTYSCLPKHSHTATISPNPHSHGYKHMGAVGYDTYYSHNEWDENVELQSYTTDATSLSVSLSETGSDSCSTDAASSLPPYYKLAFIAMVGNVDIIWPSGLVVKWSGSYNDIPSGWQLCDGTNGTPDLRNKFVYGINTSYGAGNDGDLGATGGATSHSHTYSCLPKHSHTATISPNPHSHGYDRLGKVGYDTVMSHYGSSDNADLLSYTTDATSLSVSLSETGSDSCSTDAASSLPPYYKLAFVMKL